MVEGLHKLDHAWRAKAIGEVQTTNFVVEKVREMFFLVGAEPLNRI